MDGIGMDECDLEPEEPVPRLAVDELRARGLELVEGRQEVVRGESDVMHARPPAREEAPDGRVVAGRAHELDTPLADEHRRRLDALVAERLAMLEASLEEALVRLDRLVEIGHGDAEVVDPPHGLDSTREG
jgi:hypothetical protein